MAVIHYQRRHFNDALIVLERVFKIIEAVEETVAQTTCLLLLDLYIAKRVPEKALVVLQYLEKTLATSAKQKEDKSEKKSGGGDDGDGDEGHKSPDRDMLKFYLHQYKARNKLPLYCTTSLLLSKKAGLESVCHVGGGTGP